MWYIATNNVMLVRATTFLGVVGHPSYPACSCCVFSLTVMFWRCSFEPPRLPSVFVGSAEALNRFQVFATIMFELFVCHIAGVSPKK